MFVREGQVGVEKSACDRFTRVSPKPDDDSCDPCLALLPITITTTTTIMKKYARLDRGRSYARLRGSLPARRLTSLSGWTPHWPSRSRRGRRTTSLSPVWVGPRAFGGAEGGGGARRREGYASINVNWLTMFVAPSPPPPDHSREKRCATRALWSARRGRTTRRSCARLA